MSRGTELSPEDHARIFREEILPEYQLSEKSTFKRPKAIILAGQSGSGKGRLSGAAKSELSGDVVIIDPDALRSAHPRVNQFRHTHPYSWSSDTHPDASKWADELLDVTISSKKNLIFDTTLSDGQWSSELIKDLQEKGYEVEVRAIATPKLESDLGVEERFSRSINERGYGRHVPEGARDAIYDKVPVSLDTIHAQTNVRIRIFNREDIELYDSRVDPRLPSAALEEARDTRLKDPKITRRLSEGWKEQQAWHRDLPERLANNPHMDPSTTPNVLAQRTQELVVEGAERNIKAATHGDFVTRVRPNVVKGVGIAGIALSLYDAADTGLAMKQQYAMGNATAAESGLIHFGSRTVGGFAGAGAGVAGAAAVGWETGPGVLVFMAVGGIAGGVAGDKFAEWTDNRRIYHQDDRQGNTWTLDPDNPGLGWQRKAPVDASNDAIDNATASALRASPTLANELNYHATSTSAELVLGAPPVPRNPFMQPANETDAHSVSRADWSRDSDSGQWRRDVVLAFVEHGLSPKRTEIAKPGRAAELDRAAAQTLMQNTQNSLPALAARYQDAYARNGWAAYGEMPEAVRATRANYDTLIASDGNRYLRQGNGAWVSGGVLYDSTAKGPLREELDLTREVLQARLPPTQAIRALPPMTEAAHLRDTVAGAYANANVTPTPERAEASAVAVRATWTAKGLNPATTALQLQPGPDGHYGPDSPIASLRLESDGKTYRISAITTTDQIQRAQETLQTVPRAIGVPSAQERDVRTQTLQKAGRLDVSSDAQQVARHEAVTLPAAFAPARGFAKDLRDETHPGHFAYRKALDDVQRMEARNAVPHGEHSERVAAAVAIATERDHLQIQRLDLGKDGQVIAVERGPYPNFEERRVPIDTHQALTQGFEKTSTQWLEARSPHYASNTPAKARSDEQASSIAQLSANDQAMFARIRQGAPAHVSDDVVTHTMLLAKKDGITDASKIEQTALVGDKLWVIGNTPGFRVATDVSGPAPQLQETLQQTQDFDQQRELQVAQDTMQRSQTEAALGMRLA